MKLLSQSFKIGIFLFFIAVDTKTLILYICDFKAHPNTFGL